MRPGERASVVVEFSGIPGAGKSFLAHGLVLALAAEGHSVDEPLVIVSPDLGRARRVNRKVRLATVEALRHPASAARLVLAIARSGQSPRDLVHRSQNWLVVRALIRRARQRSGIHVFDQGIVQELCSIGYRGQWRTCLEAAAPGPDDLAPDVIVRAVAPVGTAVHRLASRGGEQSRVEALDAVQQERVLHSQATQLDEIEQVWLERYGTRRGTRRIELDNDGAADAVALDRILEQLR